MGRSCRSKAIATNTGLDQTALRTLNSVSSPDPLNPGTFLSSSPTRQDVPEADIRQLAEAVVNAHGFAKSERLLTGYLVLYAGLLVAQERQEPWAKKLAALWDEALNEYKTLYPRNWGDLA